MADRRHPVAALCGAIALFGVTACAPSRSGVAWQPMPAIASGTSYGMGVSALYAGEISDGLLLAAGGANFLDTPAAEGGAKRFYDEIWLLSAGDAAWRAAGNRLPAPSAYGAAWVLDDGIVVAGGANEAGTLDAVWMLRNDCGDVTVRVLPELPVPVEQGAAARDGAMLYLVGGLTNGTPSNGLYGCDTATFRWRLLGELPESLVQPVAMAHDGMLYIWGGYDPVEKRALDYGYRYDTAAERWERIDGVPDGGTLTGAAAVVLPSGRLLVAGGVDRDIFTEALRLPPDKIREYQRQTPEAYRFRRKMWLFDPPTARWEPLGEAPVTARAGAVLVATGQGIVLLGGELKPGIRTAENVRTTDLE